jgi:hypothetical protein
MADEDADIQFPLLGFTTNVDIWGFEDLNALTVCGPDTLKKNMQDGMELIDAGGRRWRVRGARRLGPTGSWIGRLFGRGLSRIEHDLEPLPSVSLGEVQVRAVAAMEAHPEYWCEDDERETVLVARIAEVRATKAIGEIHQVLGLDNFMDY